MHSFHPSRGRIFFEVLCALGMAASCLGAWMDLGTPALLPAAAISALYGLVHLFDMRRPRPAVAVGVADVAVAMEPQGDLLSYVPAGSVEPLVEVAEVVEEAQTAVVELTDVLELGTARLVAETEPPAAKLEAKKPNRKRPKRSVEAEAVAEAEIAAEPEPEVAEPFADLRPAEPTPGEEDHSPVTPLFEPEPFVRQQRAVFGRKAG